MMVKTGTEVQKIFCWSRQNYRSVIDLLGKEKFKQGDAGIAYSFNEDEMNRLLDIKIFQLAGCENTEIKNTFDARYDLDKAISDQIRQHEKKILILKFLRDIRSDIQEYAKLSPEQVTDINKKSAEVSKLPSLGSQEYYEVTWDFVELVFIIDFLTQNKSREADQKSNNKKILDALFIIEKLLQIQGKPIKREDIANILLDLSDYPIGDDQDIKSDIKEVLSQYEEQKADILDIYKQTQIDPVTDQTDNQAGEAYRNLAMHFFNFISDYFVGESELNNLFMCIRDFINGLDQEKLKAGVIKLKAL